MSTEQGTGSRSHQGDEKSPETRARMTTTKREQREAARADRKRRAATAQRNARMRQFVLLGVATLIILGIIVAAVVTRGFGMMNQAVGHTVAIEGSDHVAEGSAIAYKSRPPSSGPHYPTWSQNFGLLDPPIPAGTWVHNLEHGVVVFLYNCPSGCADVVQQFRDLYAELPLGRNARGGRARAIIESYSDMDHKIAAVAWGWVLELDEFDKDQLRQFYEARIDRGPECVNFSCP